MITNLLAAIVVTLVTNTATTDNAVRVPSNYGFIYANGQPSWEMRIETPATEKTDIVTVKEFRHLKFECEGKEFREQLSERVVSEKRTTYQLKQDWQVARETFEKDPQPKIWITTNSFIQSILVTNLCITNRLN